MVKVLFVLERVSMIFSVKPAVIQEKPLIFDLLQLYMDELSRFPDENPDYKDENGIYHYPYLDHYWKESERFPYLLLDEGEIAGFALVRLDGDHWEMAEFYVLPQFRRRGLAMTCVRDIFKRHPGGWKIMHNRHNQAGRALWWKLAERFAQGEILAGEEDASHDYLGFLV